MACQGKFQIQPGTVKDIPILVAHHRRMFEEIWAVRGFVTDALKLEEMDQSYTRKLQEDLVDGRCNAWVIKNRGKILF